MISHRKLLPLVETGKDYPEEYNIKIYDIWEFERSQAFEIIAYDWDFADQLLNKIERVIFENDNHGSEIAPLSISHINKLQRYSASLNDIKERFALDFFFALERYYPFNNDITIYRKHPEYLFWLSLKLRQYDLALINTSNFLDFQLRKNYKNNSEEFIELIDICIKQYPDLFSDRLIERINKWIEKHSQIEPKFGFVAQIDNKLKATENQDLYVFKQKWTFT